MTPNLTNLAESLDGNAGAVIRVLVEALEKLSRLGNGNRLGNSDGNVMAQQALTRAEQLAGGLE